MTKKPSSNDLSSQLTADGIHCKGFGILPKAVMIDPDLTLEAKTIYAYLCSYAGNGDTAFPSVSKITSDLSICCPTYYKHIKLLIKNDYIEILKTTKATGFNNNLYKLVDKPQKFNSMPDNIKMSQMYSKIRTGGLKAAGFGMIPKSIMLDDRLPIKSKGIYAYFCTFSRKGEPVSPQVGNILYHLNINKITYYRYYNELKKYNYVTAVQRHINGRMNVNDYYLNVNPDENIKPQKCLNIITNKDLNLFMQPDYDKIQRLKFLQHTKMQHTFLTANKNNSDKNNFNTTCSIHLQDDEQKKTLAETIKTQIDYDRLYTDTEDKELLSFILSVLIKGVQAKTASFDGKKVFIQDKLLSLTSHQIKSVYSSLKNALRTTSVRNTYTYVLKSLCNATEATAGCYYTSPALSLQPAKRETSYNIQEWEDSIFEKMFS